MTMQPEIAALLVPISPEKPAGDNLEYEPLFDVIRDARESDPLDVSQGEWALREPKKADWQKVNTLCCEALNLQSKDLQLACWFVESRCQLLGPAGLISGVDFLSEFITRFWFQCWPSLEEDGVAIRRGRLMRLDRDLSQHLFTLPLLSHTQSSLSHWLQVLAFEHKINSHPDSRDMLIEEEGDLTAETFEKISAHFSSFEISQQANLTAQLTSALTQMDARYVSISQDTEGSVFTKTLTTLKEIDEYLQRLAQRVVPQAFEETAVLKACEVVEEHSEIPFITTERTVAPPSVMTRELAVSQMLAIADHFRRHEPSSPVPYLMERAARWAGMTLTEWLEEMLNDTNSLNDINKVLGQNHE
ncbi:type VI secretion system protein TssA [Mangrovibacter yixingensis]|uniref:type VI secretion system protein TssA n=1 Tax=Mangrovibacter yixingensis TaxID=1529639 RepID=UPI001CFD24F9|nr:type VI secretion system protein TssA [Mangrovibacter yixingensis]